MDHALRRQRLAARLEEWGYEAFLVTHLPNVRYLSGFTGSNAQLLITGNGGLFFTDGRYIEQSRRQVPGVERVIYSKDFPKVMAEACRRFGVQRLGFEGEGITQKGYTDIASEVRAEFVSVVGAVEGLRRMKDPEELALIERAQAITDQALEAVLPRLTEGTTEREAALWLDRAMEDLGAEKEAFETIAAFGENAAEPHHSPSDRALKRGDVLKLDFGARYEGYHADMTRTVAFGESPDELREIYEVVRKAQQAGIDAVRGGVTGGEADRAARSVIDDAGYGEAFSHGLGHGVGLEIHESPTLRKDGEDVVPVNAVVTVEPGVYVPGVGGVRIEDMVEVLEDGCRPLPSSTKEFVVL